MQLTMILPVSFTSIYPLRRYEVCIGVLGIQDICNFNCRDMGYCSFYLPGYRIQSYCVQYFAYFQGYCYLGKSIMGIFASLLGILKVIILACLLPGIWDIWYPPIQASDMVQTRYFFYLHWPWKWGQRHQNIIKLFSISKWYTCICACLVEIHLPIQEIWCRQGIFHHSLTFCELKNWGQGHQNLSRYLPSPTV